MSRASIDILFENRDWVIVDKPAGWLTVPGRDPAEATPCLGRKLEEKLSQRIWPVHRLDREVSGLVLFAKNAVSHKRANNWFETRLVHKFYEAWTTLVPQGETKTWRWKFKIARGKKRAFESPAGKEAITDATIQTSFVRGEQLIHSWRLSPLTGRSHQLRVTLAKYAGPIVGDTLYGFDASLATKLGVPDGVIALRAWELDFSDVPETERLGLPRSITATGLEEALRERS